MIFQLVDQRESSSLVSPNEPLCFVDPWSTMIRTISLIKSEWNSLVSSRLILSFQINRRQSSGQPRRSKVSEITRLSSTRLMSFVDPSSSMICKLSSTRMSQVHFSLLDLFCLSQINRRQCFGQTRRSKVSEIICLSSADSLFSRSVVDNDLYTFVDRKWVKFPCLSSNESLSFVDQSSRVFWTLGLMETKMRSPMWCAKLS